MEDKEKEFRERLARENAERDYQEWKKLNDPATVAKAEKSSRSPILWAVGLVALLVVIVFANSNSSTNNEGNSENGHWVTKCRTITELNPNYRDSDPSSITDNLEGPSRFINRRQCTDVWVND